jgi:hypothetical protein
VTGRTASDVARYEADVARMTWQYGNDVADDVDQSDVDTWHFWLLGATWPNHGLPRGTPGLANEGYVKSFWGPGDSNPGPPPHHAFAQSLRPIGPRMFLLYM